jgi:CheY-like chemotaxis protein
MPRGQKLFFSQRTTDARKFIALLLVEFGYKVIEAVDGEDAVNRFKAHKDDIQLVILDVECQIRAVKRRDEIMKIQPDIKVLFTSGYTAE